MEWTDALLTEKGIEQAKIAHRFWEDSVPEGIPIPTMLYTSPLKRCLQTAYWTFHGLESLMSVDLRVLIIENII